MEITFLVGCYKWVRDHEIEMEDIGDDTGEVYIVGSAGGGGS